MSRVVIVHWNRGVSPLVAALKNARYEVEPLSPQGAPGLRGVRDDPPDAFVIDLERRPSDGREVGAALRRRKATRHVPIVFAGGAPDKVRRARDLMPDAAFASWEDVVPAVEQALAQPPEAPVVPGTMDAYAGVGLPIQHRGHCLGMTTAEAEPTEEPPPPPPPPRSSATTNVPVIWVG
jgi:CheY-like chemotaxis protein